jgi:hypothetical protein
MHERNYRQSPMGDDYQHSSCKYRLSIKNNGYILASSPLAVDHGVGDNALQLDSTMTSI